PVERATRIQRVIADGIEDAAMISVRAGLRDYVDLRAARGAALRSVIGRADPKFGDGVERDVQPGIGLLRLLLDAAGIDAVESKVAVIQGMAAEADAAL